LACVRAIRPQPPWRSPDAGDPARD
jgi:hypothetical protein